VTEALQLAEQLGRSDIAANAMGWLARCRMATRTPVDGYELDYETIDRFGTAARVSFVFGPLNLYLAGKGTDAVALSTRSAEMADRSTDTGFIMNALAHHALGLSSVGRYMEADQVFRRVQEFGRKYGVLPLLARATSMSAGFRLAIGDYDGAEAIQTEARELAKRINFAPTIVSPGIDLLLIAARRGQPGNVDTLLNETVAGAARMPGWHEWLWQLRIEQARAELSLARGAFEETVEIATSSIEQSRTRARPKYEALGYVTRAQARQRLGKTREAIADARHAVELATATADPALVLRAFDLLLTLDGDDAAAAQAKTTVATIAGALPTADLRDRFLRSEMATRAQRR
jgi:tetratricopeptide (TPR) repeat protein